MSHRAPIKAGSVLLRVTRPMTLPSFMNPQAPSSKFQRSSRTQAPNSRVARRYCCLEIGCSLEFGVWSLEFSRFIHHPDDHPAHRALFIADRSARGGTIARDHDLLMQPGAVGIDGDLRHALRPARRFDRLAN